MQHKHIYPVAIAALGVGLVFGQLNGASAQWGGPRRGAPGQGRFQHEGGPGRPFSMGRGAGLNLNDAQREKARAIGEETRRQMEKVLTPEQRQKVKQMRPGGFGMKLTDAQRKQMDKIRSATRAKAEKIKNNSRLSEAQKREQFRALMRATGEQMRKVVPAGQRPAGAPGARRPGGPMGGLQLTDAQRKKMEAIRKNSESKFRAILTTEQRAQFDKMIAQRGSRGGRFNK